MSDLVRTLITGFLTSIILLLLVYWFWKLYDRPSKKQLELQEEKREKRKCERKWLKSRLEIDKQIYTEQCNKYRQMLEQAKSDYHRAQIAECNDRQLFKLVDRLSKPASAPVLPDQKCKKELANDFSDFSLARLESFGTRLAI